MTFLKHLKNLSSTSKYVGISTWALFNAMEELQIDEKSGVLLKMLWKCSDVFFQLKTIQKHIYKVLMRPKLKSLKSVFKFKKIHRIFVSQLLWQNLCFWDFLVWKCFSNQCRKCFTHPTTMLKICKTFSYITSLRSKKNQSHTTHQSEDIGENPVHIGKKTGSTRLPFRPL